MRMIHVAAAPAGYNSPIRAANKDTTSHGDGGSSIHILEQQRHLQEGETIICTRSNFLGNITTSCEEAASGIQSSCAVTPDGTCSYYVLDLSVLDELLANITDFLATNVTNSADAGGGVSSEGDPSSVEEIFAALFLIFLGLTDSGECKCTDSTPDCSMTNLPTDYSFNACKADPKYSYTCTIMEQEGSLFCCDIDDAQGKMKCCKSETDTGFEYECGVQRSVPRWDSAPQVIRHFCWSSSWISMPDSATLSNLLIGKNYTTFLHLVLPDMLEASVTGDLRMLFTLGSSIVLKEHVLKIRTLQRCWASA
eukprot:scaffold2115_cov97-Cylindrotheca_fusiformis.AAC.3